MAAPVESFLRLADDSGYTGKKIRAQSRTVGANSVYERALVLDRKARVFGIYECGLTQQTVSATAQDGISTGFLWLHMPTAISGCSARIRRIIVTSQASTTLVAPSAPRLAMTRFSWTGAATGASVTADPDTTYRRPQLDLRTVSTGLTVSLGAALATAGICGALSAVSAVAAHTISTLAPPFADDLTVMREDEYMVLAPGEGLVIYQDVLGTASDTRKLNIQVIFDEIDTA